MYTDEIDTEFVVCSEKVIDKITIQSVVRNQSDVIKQEIQQKKDKMAGIHAKLLEMNDPPLSLFELIRNMEKKSNRYLLNLKTSHLEVLALLTLMLQS